MAGRGAAGFASMKPAGILMAAAGADATMFKVAETCRVRGGMQDVPLQVW
jgi:hypothetical protein